ncbi:DHA2 family efflux MFS transporter permease subunit [Demequina phytophila]|uniref:DHA2 family efflux MFS transporter permease subunit n=1 Tax=Demequina phytophila TaxID=1638981 RepID=UPI000780B196|nr:DHA2 family efflux MFS transporter permease subunit [Demequina phytophila]
MNPWRALWALVIGFFMILVDTTIVSVANPSIQQGLGTDTSTVIWVTSAYLLAYAVPLLVTGRLGDRFGPKRIYLVGLTIFTLSSLACGLADALPGSGIGNLIAARVVQGLGASLMTPQTMAVITRTFPAARRGAAMALWGAVAGVATLVGPLLGGVLVDGPGWEWIFFVNVPVGVIAFIAAQVLVPHLDTHAHTFDWLGVALSGAGMFLLVFGIQEGQAHDWNAWVWGCIAAGVAVLAAFVISQRRDVAEPLLPLALFRDRNFSLANVAISSVGFAITAMFIPLVYFFQAVRGLTPTQSALMTVPTALATLALAPVAGRLTDRLHPRLTAAPGIVTTAAALVLYAVLMSPDIPIGWLLLPALLMGIGASFTWGPVSSTATRNLPLAAAGAGSGVYNATRQVGAVLGSAAIAALMVNRIAVNLGGGGPAAIPEGATGLQLPEPLRDAFTTAMAQSLLLPAAVLLVGVAAAASFERPAHLAEAVGRRPEREPQ